MLILSSLCSSVKSKIIKSIIYSESGKGEMRKDLKKRQCSFPSMGLIKKILFMQEYEGGVTLKIS